MSPTCRPNFTASTGHGWRSTWFLTIYLFRSIRGLKKIVCSRQPWLWIHDTRWLMLYWALFNRSDCGLEDFLWIVRACCCKTEPDQTSHVWKTANTLDGAPQSLYVLFFCFAILCVACAGGLVFTYLPREAFLFIHVCPCSYCILTTKNHPSTSNVRTIFTI